MPLMSLEILPCTVPRLPSCECKGYTLKCPWEVPRPPRFRTEASAVELQQCQQIFSKLHAHGTLASWGSKDPLRRGKPMLTRYEATDAACCGDVDSLKTSAKLIQRPIMSLTQMTFALLKNTGILLLHIHLIILVMAGETRETQTTLHMQSQPLWSLHHGPLFSERSANRVSLLTWYGRWCHCT